MHPDFSEFDPKRPPAWRFDRVLALLNGGRERPLRATRWDDRYVRTYLQFLRLYARAEQEARIEVGESGRSIDDAPPMYRLFGHKYDLWYAHQIHTDPDTEWRALFQASILTREDDDQIAAQFGTLPSVIYWYEKLYFDVRDRLDQHAWMAKTILGSLASRTPRSDGACTEAQRDLVYKVFAYYGGREALDAVQCGFRPGSFPARRADVEGWFESTLRSMAKIRAATALQSFEMNKFNVMQLLDLGFRVLETDAGDGGDEKRHSALESAISDLISEVPWGLSLRRTAELTSLEKQYRGAVEPRADEQMLITAGIEPPGLREYCDQVEQDD